MTMTREEYIEFLFKEHDKILKTEQRDAPVGSVVMFSGVYGRAYYTKNDSGKWDREVK